MANRIARCRAIWRPAMYHGHGRRRDFFEGWYFKVVDATEQRRYAIIPGVFLGQGDQAAHSFVQTLDGVTGQSTFHRYPLESFWASESDFHIRIGPNEFRADRLVVDLDSPELRMQGELQFTQLVPWPVSLLSPGIMGWYALVPLMETYHGVVSLDHLLYGTLTVNGEHIPFDGGRGYIEKDWGQAFPQAWVWMQSNHFEQPGTSFTASTAIIPWLGSAFHGLIIGLWHRGTLHRLATYTGAGTEFLHVEGNHLTWRVRGQGRMGSQKRLYALDIQANSAKTGLLHGPSRTEMLQRVPETLTATLEIHWQVLTDHGQETVFRGTGKYAGLELGGETERLFTGNGASAP